MAADSTGRLGTGVVRDAVADMFDRRPHLSDADVAAILSRRFGRRLSGQVIAWHRARLNIPGVYSRMRGKR